MKDLKEEFAEFKQFLKNNQQFVTVVATLFSIIGMILIVMFGFSRLEQPLEPEPTPKFSRGDVVKTKISPEMQVMSYSCQRPTASRPGCTYFVYYFDNNKRVVKEYAMEELLEKVK